jgi:lipoate-protein ligase A
MEGQALNSAMNSTANHVTNRALRPAVEVLRGSGIAATREIGDDFAMLARAGAGPAVRTWTCIDATVVLGVSRELELEVDVEACDRRGVAVVRRASGGGTVLIGPGTLQYAFALPHPTGAAPCSIDDVKRFCSAVVGDALAASGVEAAIESDVSGDLHIGARKIAGVALRRVRDATLLHGTLLVNADLALIAEVLRHPSREPAWRQGRGHLAFVANLGNFDREKFADQLQNRLVRWPPMLAVPR